MTLQVVGVGLAVSIVRDLVDRVHRRGLARIGVLTDTPWSSAVDLYAVVAVAVTATGHRLNSVTTGRPRMDGARTRPNSGPSRTRKGD